MRKRNGWAQVPHSWEQLDGPKVMSEREAWLWLCSWAEKYTSSQNLLEPPTLGYLTTSFGWSHHNKTRRFLDKLEGLNMVCVKRAKNVLRIFIVISHLDVDVCEKRAEKVHDIKNNNKKDTISVDSEVKKGPTVRKKRAQKVEPYGIPEDWHPTQATLDKLGGEGYSPYRLETEHKKFIEWMQEHDIKRPGFDISFRFWVRKGRK